MGTKRVLLVGAGAEIPLNIGSGDNFTLNTFYRSNRELYSALAKYYKAEYMTTRKTIPPYSQQSFLTTSSRLFKKALTSVLENESLSQAIFRDAPDSDLKVKALNAMVLLQAGESLPEKYFDNSEMRNLMSLLFENEDAAELIKEHNVLDKAHYGVLEEQYSSLIQPSSNPVKFWRLVNFYWNAFFFIAKPILSDSGQHDATAWVSDDYLRILNNLEETVSCIYSKASDVIQRHGYGYHKDDIAGRFDCIITTNYTPYTIHFLDNQSKENIDQKIAWLSGQLCQFECFDSLSTFDIRANPERASGHAIFPFLMCQSPVKPIVNTTQIQEYEKARRFLADARELTVLGYSFCPEDTHIITMVTEALSRDPNKRLTFFRHTKDPASFNHAKALRDLSELLGLSSEQTKGQITLITLPGDDMSPFFNHAKETTGDPK